MVFIFCALCAYLFMPLAAGMPLRVLDPIEFGMRPGSHFSLMSFVCHECAIGKHVVFRGCNGYLGLWPGVILPSCNAYCVCRPTSVPGACTSPALAVQ